MTKKDKLTIFIAIAAVVLLSFFTWQRHWSNSGYPAEIASVLQLAGSNRKELVNVLKHYSKDPDDSLKLRAAGFLIMNIPGKYSVYYDAPWNDVATAMLRWTSSYNKQLVVDNYRLGEPVGKNDVTHITAEYLINNIELAFKVWHEVPWGKDIPFDIFCEEILPYRMYTEPLENWREKALTSFADLYQSFIEDTTMTTVNACIKINSILPRFRIDKDFPRMNYSQLMASTRGTCDEMAALAVFSMRALGIPVSIDYTPKWPDKNHGHTWNCVYDTYGIYIPFMGTESNPDEPNTKVIGRPASKIYRRTFSIQNLWADISNIPPSLRDIDGRDVTAEYERSVELKIPMFERPSSETGFAYLATPYESEWNPVGFGVIEDDTLHFSSVGKQALYLPVYYQNDTQTAAYYPFWLGEEGDHLFFRPDTSHQEILLTEINSEDNLRINRMLHGRIIGANLNDFSDAKLLHTIKEVRGAFSHTVEISNRSKYRYLLYYSPDGSRCNVAELEFYDESGSKLNGTVIGTTGSWSNTPSTRDKAFDGDPTTFFDAADLNNGWVGLELDNPVTVSKIRFMPRTEGNIIYEGHTYELYYWDGLQWFSLGKQVAASHLLRYRAPSNALYYMQNSTTEKKGSIFIIQDGKQKWL